VEVFAANCESVHVICLREGEHALPSHVTVTSLGKERGVPRLRRALTFVRTIWNIRREYDAVFVHMNPEYVVVGGLLWRILGKRIGLWYAHRTVNIKLRIAHLFAHHVFTGSKESFRIPSSKVLVTGQGVDTTVFIPPQELSEESSSRLLVVGRISPIKNLELAIRTVCEVRRVKPNATLRIVGAIGKPEDQSYLEQIVSLIHELHAEDFVTLVGGKDPTGVREELEHADVFLHTSQTNSADKTAVEAMATGVYQVTSSPVYRKDLPESCFQTPDPLVYAREVVRYVSLPRVEQDRLKTVMREAAVREHSLERLIRIIVEKLQS
jgi:glycosyltransferase involved in cell wall biosynthesis